MAESGGTTLRFEAIPHNPIAHKKLMDNLKDGEISAEVGTRLLFENDRVRVWDLQLSPGESTGFHRHTTDFLYVVIGDGTLQTVFPDGQREPPRKMHDGDVRFRDVADKAVHEAVNVGSGPWRNIVVELKR